MTNKSLDQAVACALEQKAAGQAQLAERMQAELAFAEALAARTPGKRRAWNGLIERASRMILAATPATLAQAVADAEGILTPLSVYAKQFAIHCVGHAHIDMNWLWSWPETVSITCDTFATVLRLMEEFGDFCFSQSQASVYAIVKEHQPELLEGIRQRVHEGRWEVTAVHWVEGDKNMASGESLARHMLYTRRFMKELFGLEAEDMPLDWECDMFGHAHTIPAILVRGGARRYYMCRSGAPEKPPVFWWQAPDGSRVLVVRDITGYNDHLGPHIAQGLLRFYDMTGMKEWMEVYGVGDHGGGPTRRDILRAHEMNAWPVFPRVKLATTRGFYELLEQRGEAWPVLNQEINFVFAGCYTSQSLIKRMNRLGEQACVEAESAAVMAERIAGRTYPMDKIREAWINVLFGQFHDILPGSGIHWTREYQSGLFQKTAAITHSIITQSYRAVAALIHTRWRGAEEGANACGGVTPSLGAGVGRGAMEGGLSCVSHVNDGARPVVVFNPVAWRREEIVQATIWDDSTCGTRERAYVVRYADGRAVAAQVIKRGNYWGHDFVDVAFPVSVGALGYTALRIEEGRGEELDKVVRVYESPARYDAEMPSVPAMENEYLRVEFDRATGGVRSLYDKERRKEMVAPGAALGVLEFACERARSMSAWILGDTGIREVPRDVAGIRVTQRGPYVASVETRVRVASSEVSVTYTLQAGSRLMEIAVQTLWVERGDEQRGTPVLRMRFPLALQAARARYEIPFGSIAREEDSGEEVPGLRWASVTGKNGRARAGCAVLNDCKYGHALEGSTLTVTLIRSSYDPDPLPEMREHRMRLAVMPHGGEISVADVMRCGAAFNQALQVVNTDVHAGRLAAEAEGMRVEPGHVLVTSVRKAQDGDGLIVHVQETDGRAARARVELTRAMFGTINKVTEVDFLERAVAAGTAQRTGNGFSVEVPACGIACVKVE